MQRIKKNPILVSVLFLSMTLEAQTTPEAFLSQLPAVPNSVCNANQSIIDNFTIQIQNAEEAFQTKMDQISDQETANWERNKNKIISTNAANLGLSTSDMKKLMNENISEKEGLAIANKSVESRYGASVEELQKVANMSEAEQEQWAEDFAGKQMQKARHEPEATAKKSEKNKHLYDLATEQKDIADRLSILWEKVGKTEKNYLYQDSIQNEVFQKRLEPLISDPVLLGGCASAAEIQRARVLERQIYSIKLQHCEKMSPILLDYILQYQSALKMSFPDYARLTEIVNELSKIQNGVEAIVSELPNIGNVSSYARLLSESYKYWIPKNTD